MSREELATGSDAGATVPVVSAAGPGAPAAPAEPAAELGAPSAEPVAPAAEPGGPAVAGAEASSAGPEAPSAGPVAPEAGPLVSAVELGALVAELGDEVRAGQAAVDALDEAVAARLGVNRTDLRCLDVLMNELAAAATPGQLGARLGLSTGSVTAMIDRLAKLGYVSRTPDPGDRRKVVVRPTELAAQRAGEIYGPIVAGGAVLLERYSADELRLLIDFTRRSRELQQQQLAEVRGER